MGSNDNPEDTINRGMAEFRSKIASRQSRPKKGHR